MFSHAAYDAIVPPGTECVLGRDCGPIFFTSMVLSTPRGVEISTPLVYSVREPGRLGLARNRKPFSEEAIHPVEEAGFTPFLGPSLFVFCALHGEPSLPIVSEARVA